MVLCFFSSLTHNLVDFIWLYILNTMYVTTHIAISCWSCRHSSTFMIFPFGNLINFPGLTELVSYQTALPAVFCVSVNGDFILPVIQTKIIKDVFNESVSLILPPHFIYQQILLAPFCKFNHLSPPSLLTAWSTHHYKSPELWQYFSN